MNLCEIGLFAVVWGVSKVSWDNYHEIWWKCFLSKIHKFRGVQWGQTNSPLHILLIIKKKTEKLQEHDLYLNQILHHFE